MKLQRYTNAYDVIGNPVGMRPAIGGDYYRCDDVDAALAAHTDPTAMKIKRYNLEPLVPASRGFQLKERDDGSLCYYDDVQSTLAARDSEVKRLRDALESMKPMLVYIAGDPEGAVAETGDKLLRIARTALSQPAATEGETK